jgi:hypothetical protein
MRDLSIGDLVINDYDMLPYTVVALFDKDSDQALPRARQEGRLVCLEDADGNEAALYEWEVSLVRDVP